MTQVHYRHATVRRQRRFYREAGPADAPALESALDEAVPLIRGFLTANL